MDNNNEDKHDPVDNVERNNTIPPKKEFPTLSANNDDCDEGAQKPPSQECTEKPQITVSLPKHVATKLLELVQSRDMALLSLGIISVQFDNNQIIPLTPTSQSNAIQPKRVSISPVKPSIMVDNHHMTQRANSPASSLGDISYENGLHGMHEHATVDLEASDRIAISPTSNIRDDDDPFEDSIMRTTNNLDSKSIINKTDSSLLDTSIFISVEAKDAADHERLAKEESLKRQTTGAVKRSVMSIVYDDEDEDNTNEDEAGEVENQHSNFEIHQLTQLDFADPIELEMFDNDNLLFPDYT